MKKWLIFGFTIIAILSFGAYYYFSQEEAEITEQKANIPATESDSPLESNYLGNYTINDTGFGTMVQVSVNEQSGERTIKRNALPNHETGEFPNSGNPNAISEQDFSETYPLNPIYIGTAQSARVVGIAINGIKLEPDTVERAICQTGEVHSIEAIQELTDLGLDFNNAHVQPNGEYHYHGISELLVEIYDNDNDLVHVAFAADGHKIYYSKSNAYKPSYIIGTTEREGTNCTYTTPGPSGGETITFGKTKDGSLKSDWDYDPDNGDLDECNGIEINGEYIYLMTDSYPYIGRCLMGEFTETQTPEGGAQQGPPQQGPPPPRR